jgi:hypothetical protein
MAAAVVVTALANDVGIVVRWLPRQAAFKRSLPKGARFEATLADATIKCIAPVWLTPVRTWLYSAQLERRAQTAVGRYPAPRRGRAWVRSLPLRSLL